MFESSSLRRLVLPELVLPELVPPELVPPGLAPLRARAPEALQPLRAGELVLAPTFERGRALGSCR